MHYFYHSSTKVINLKSSTYIHPQCHKLDTIYVLYLMCSAEVRFSSNVLDTLLVEDIRLASGLASFKMVRQNLVMDEVLHRPS